MEQRLAKQGVRSSAGQSRPARIDVIAIAIKMAAISILVGRSEKAQRGWRCAAGQCGGFIVADISVQGPPSTGPLARNAAKDYARQSCMCGGIMAFTRPF